MSSQMRCFRGGMFIPAGIVENLIHALFRERGRGREGEA